MALLKKVKAATLMETMVSTVLILVIFMITSLILNSLFSSSLQGNTQGVSDRLQRLEYEYHNGLIPLRYDEEWGEWQIELISENVGNGTYLSLKAMKKESNTEIKNYVALAQ